MRLLLLDCYLDRPGGQGFFRPWLAPEDPVVVSLSSEPIPFRPDEVDAVVITGSRGSIVHPEPWMVEAGAWLREAVALDVPILGCCFGHQLLAWAMLGADAVETAPGPEVGFPTIHRLQSDPLLDALPTDFATYVSHEDQVRPVAGLTVLARSDACAVHALRVPGCRAWGVQFHVEYPREEQLRILRYRAERHPDLRLDPEAMLATAPDTAPQATALFGRFLQLVQQRMP